jgi:hypothetical protein
MPIVITATLMKKQIHFHVPLLAALALVAAPVLYAQI